jgi:thiamine monophosphate kinase
VTDVPAADVERGDTEDGVTADAAAVSPQAGLGLVARLDRWINARHMLEFCTVGYAVARRCAATVRRCD